MTLLTDTTQRLSASARALIDGPTNWIGGVWEDGQAESELTIVNPSTASPLRTIRNASTSQAERAVAAARKAFETGPWASFSPRERSAALLRLADLMDQHRAELEEIVVTEVGSPITLTRFMQVGMPITNLRWAADMALKGPQGGYEEALAPDFTAGLPSSSLLQRVPVGVVAGITGYNFPINSVAWKLGPGLAAGCTLVFKPSPRTPLSTLALMRLVEQAELPPGVVNVVCGDGDVGNVLSTHPDVDLVAFTGSLKVGQAIMRGAAETTKRLVLELGGKSANIILPTADLSSVVGPSILRYVRNAGQGCGATTRTLVPRDRYEEFAEHGQRFVQELKVGSPWDEDTDLGPLIRSEQRDFVAGFVDRAVEQGATVIAGGGRPDGLDGYFYKPTLIGGVDNSWEISRDELFGPVGVLIPYDTVDDAIRIAHDSPYGLHAAVYGDPTEAYQVGTRLRTGAVSLNGGGYMHPRGPWGGFKLSGFGREMGDDGFREFFQVKHIQWPIR